MESRTQLFPLLTALAVAGACSSAPEKAADPGLTAEVSTESTTGEFQAAPASAENPATAEEWGEARGGLLRNFAFRALDHNLLEEGRHYLAQACEADPDDAASHAALARLYLAENDPASALVYAARASAAAPESPEVSMVYAAALAESNQESKATAELEKAWRAVETDPEFARSVLLHYAATGSVDRAEDFVAWCMTENPDAAGSWATAGDLLLAQGDLDAAAESYRRALELDPTISTPASVDDLIGRGNRNEDAMNVAARAAEGAGQWPEAEQLYRFLCSKENVTPDARLGLARCMEEQGRFVEAEIQLAQVGYGVRGWRGHLLQSRLDIAGSRWSQARSALLLALEERPGLKAAELLLAHVDAQLAASTQPE
jgi:tetratricopeptide (TPR) repeat protein